MEWISELKTLGRTWDIQNMFEPNETVNLKKNPKVNMFLLNRAHYNVNQP